MLVFVPAPWKKKEEEEEQLRQALAASLGDRSLVDEDQAIAASIEAHQQRRNLRHAGDQEEQDMQRALAASQVVPDYPSPSVTLDCSHP